VHLAPLLPEEAPMLRPDLGFLSTFALPAIPAPRDLGFLPRLPFPTIPAPPG
jgi:hypothetical protein